MITLPIHKFFAAMGVTTKKKDGIVYVEKKEVSLSLCLLDRYEQALHYRDKLEGICCLCMKT